MNISPTLLIFLIAFTYGIARMGEWLIRDIIRRNAIRVVWIDSEANRLSVAWEKPKDGTIVKGEKKYVVDGAAKYHGTYPTWLIDKVTGFSYIAPYRQELVEQGGSLMAKLLVSDPTSYWREQAVNKMRNALNANDDSQDPYGWVKVVAIAGVVALIAILGILLFFIYRIMQVGQAANLPGVGG